MPPNGTKNLIPFSERTKEEASKEGRKGGINSGKTRRKQAQLRKSVQSLLNKKYDIKENGKKIQVKGFDIIARKIMQQALDEKSRNWRSAVEFIMRLTDNQTILNEERAEAEIALLQAKIQAIQSGDTTALDTLDEILTAVRLSAEKTENETKAESESDKKDK